MAVAVPRPLLVLVQPLQHEKLLFLSSWEGHASAVLKRIHPFPIQFCPLIPISVSQLQPDTNSGATSVVVLVDTVLTQWRGESGTTSSLK